MLGNIYYGYNTAKYIIVKNRNIRLEISLLYGKAEIADMRNIRIVCLAWKSKINVLD
jgi:hypothetical protein